MELQKYIDIFRRRIIVIILVTAMAAMVVTAIGVFIQPIYTAQTTVRITFDVGISELVRRSEDTTRLMRTYEYVLTTSPILEEAIARLHPKTEGVTVGSLRRQLQVERVTGTELMTIAIADEDPALARDLSNMLASLLIEYVDTQTIIGSDQKSATEVIQDQLLKSQERIDSYVQQLEAIPISESSSVEADALRQQIRIEEDAYRRLLNNYELVSLNDELRANSVSIIQPATLPFNPSNRLGIRDIGMAIIIGLIGGVGFALVLENLDTRVHSAEQLERISQLPVLGKLPDGMLLVDETGQIDQSSKANRTISEAYRLFSLNLQRLDQETPLKSILITSPVANQGKSVVATNLAQTLAERGKMTFLVEADMRRPVVGMALNIPNNAEVGLSSLLTNLSELEDVLKPTKQTTLFVVCGGPKPPNPTSLLGSPQMESTLAYLVEQAQITLIEASPVLGLADVSILAPQTDGVILVVTQDVSNRNDVTQALKQLHTAAVPVLGLVLLQKSSKSLNYG